MSHFITQTGLVVTCESPTCICNAGPQRPKSEPHPTTAGAVLAADEERWFDEIQQLVEHYLTKYRDHYEAPKSEREWRQVEVHEAKRAVIDRFYAMGWDQP